MNIVSFNQIIDLNHLLQKKDLQFKVHIRDACGTQSFYIEQIGNSGSIGLNEEIYDTIEKYFKSSDMTVVYHNNKHQFTIQ